MNSRRLSSVDDDKWPTNNLPFIVWGFGDRNTPEARDRVIERIRLAELRIGVVAFVVVAGECATSYTSGRFRCRLSADRHRTRGFEELPCR